MPITEITSITTTMADAMPIFGQVLVVGALKTASTDGPIAITGVRAPNSDPASISHPVMNPRYGLMARPTHSKEAPQLAFHRFSRRYGQVRQSRSRYRPPCLLH